MVGILRLLTALLVLLLAAGAGCDPAGLSAAAGTSSQLLPGTLDVTSLGTCGTGGEGCNQELRSVDSWSNAVASIGIHTAIVTPLFRTELLTD